MTVSPYIKAALAGLLLAGAGCASAIGPDRAVTVAVSKSGAILVHGKDVGLSQLPRTLRNMGAAAQTRIQIDIPADMPSLLLKQIDRTLRSAGFRYVHYTGPRHAESFTGDSQSTKRRAF